MKFVSDEHVGAWMFHAKGNGIWFNVGNTIHFTDHGDAMKKFGANGNEDMCNKAASAGYAQPYIMLLSTHTKRPHSKPPAFPYVCGLSELMLAVRFAHTTGMTAYSSSPTRTVSSRHAMRTRIHAT